MASSTAVGTSSRPVRTSRQQIKSYNESSSAESASDDDDEQTAWRASSRLRTVAAINRPKRATGAPRSYREPSSDEDLERVISRYPEMVTPSTQNQNSHRPSPRPSRPTTRRQIEGPSPAKRKRVSTQSPRKRRHADAASITAAPALEVNESAPPWQTLPYHILLNIFLHALQPSPVDTDKTLLNVALLCRAFAEPALSALYHTPPINPSTKAHKLLFLLSQPVESLSMNYSTKVQELLIDVRLTLMYKAGVHGYFDLSKLVQKVPHIKSLRLYDYSDGKSPLMWADRTPRWRYPESLFETLETSNVRLHTFDWNSRYMEPRTLLDTMLARHLGAPFQTIRNLNIFHIPSDDIVAPRRTEYPESPAEVIETQLGEALCRLPNLQAVTFTDCTAVNELLFLSMPSTLTSLTLDNCDEVGTIAFVMFLSNSGACLREIVLRHNRHLNMSFMTVLKEACPKLERLSANFIMHNWPPHYNGMPHFKNLLKAEDVPTWPETLQEIELQQLRQWDKPRAATFLASLVDAAPNLKDLRKIVINATVHMGWQDRASFRRQWINKLERTFLRKSHTPESNTTVEANLAHASTGAALTGQRHSHRHSARVARQKLSEVDDEDEDEYEDEENDGDMNGNPEESHSTTYVQGMCEIVSLTISNQRPAESQFSEGDFLDSEQSGDEDWEGEDWDPESGTHAW